MTRKIFRSILLVAGVVLAAGMVIMTGCLYSYFGGVQEQQLQDELSLAVSGVENGGTAYLERLPAERFRLTWIASDGRVLYDTQVVDVASMENHAGRQEVQEALKNGSGESSRYSDTLLQQTLYVARRLTDGTVLRISVSRATAGMLALGMLQPMLVVLAAALIFAGLMAGRLSRRIVDPLNRLDLEHPLENDAYEELASTRRSTPSCGPCGKRPMSSPRSPAVCRRVWYCWTRKERCSVSTTPPAGSFRRTTAVWAGTS